MAIHRKPSAIGRLRGSYNLIISHASAKLERTIRMSSPIARILHFSFETAEDLNLWVMKYETETSELAKEAIQRTLIKTDETSLVICNIYRNEEDADNVFERLSKWSGTVKAARTWESFNLTGEVVFSEPKY